jgi:predicted Fe-S protein YdhL (DUF1289 family)
MVKCLESSRLDVEKFTDFWEQYLTMANFTPCQGKNACRDDGVLCLTCGRKLSEVTKLRELMQELATLAVFHDYENVEEFTQYIARKVEKMVDHKKQGQTN